jgi:hypothetical protein
MKTYKVGMLIVGICVLVIIYVADLQKTDAQKAEVMKSQYTIINEETLTDIKTMIDIRLNSEVNEETLYKIANELREDGRRKYQRVFICYYLQDMEVDAGAWATSHFNPYLDVKILGLSKKEKSQLLEETASSKANIFGRWIDDSPFVAGVYVITKKGNIFELSIKFKDGSEMTSKLIEKNVGGQKRWMEEDNDFGEYYVLNDDGTLSQYDNEGLIKTLPIA